MKKTMKELRICGVVLLAGLVTGCANHHLEGQNAFFQGNYTKAQYHLEKLKRKNDINTPLYMLDLGMAYMEAGDYYDARGAFFTAEKSMEKNINILATGVNIIISDVRKPYRGLPHDSIMAHYYNGVSFLREGDYEKAIVEFKKSLLSDKGKKVEQNEDFSPVHYLMGFAYEEQGYFDDAYVALKNVTKSNPDCAYGWYELARLARRQGLKDDYHKFIDTFRSLAPDASLSQPSGDEEYGEFIIVLDCGLGPLRRYSRLTKLKSGMDGRRYKEKYAKVYIDGAYAGKTCELGSVTDQAKTAGGLFWGGLARKALGTAPRKALSIASLGMSEIVTGGNEADIRYWGTLPGEIHLFIGKAPLGLRTIKLDFFDKKDRPLERFQQVWHYIPVNKRERTLLLLKSVNDLHNQNKK